MAFIPGSWRKAEGHPVYQTETDDRRQSKNHQAFHRFDIADEASIGNSVTIPSRLVPSRGADGDSRAGFPKLVIQQLVTAYLHLVSAPMM